MEWTFLSQSCIAVPIASSYFSMPNLVMKDRAFILHILAYHMIEDNGRLLLESGLWCELRLYYVLSDSIVGNTAKSRPRLLRPRKYGPMTTAKRQQIIGISDRYVRSTNLLFPTSAKCSSANLSRLCRLGLTQRLPALNRFSSNRGSVLPSRTVNWPRESTRLRSDRSFMGFRPALPVWRVVRDPALDFMTYCSGAPGVTLENLE